MQGGTSEMKFAWVMNNCVALCVSSAMERLVRGYERAIFTASGEKMGVKDGVLGFY